MPNQSLVLELQELATSNSSDLSELLRKTLLVATKLGLTDFKMWASNELHGYERNDVRLLNKRMELKKDGKWTLVANGYWEIKKLKEENRN